MFARDRTAASCCSFLLARRTRRRYGAEAAFGNSLPPSCHARRHDEEPTVRKKTGKTRRSHAERVYSPRTDS